MIDYTSLLSPTVTEIPPSGIRKFFDLLETMDDVVALTVGQPDFITPWHIREAGIDSLIQGKTYYTSNSGTFELRREISAYLNRRFGLEPYDPRSEIIVTVGGSDAIDIAMRTVLVPGDEVIIPNPAFVCYEPLVRMTGATPVILDTFVEDKFKITPERLKAAITPKTKLLVLPFPNNPTGAIMTAEELEEIAKVLRDTNILVLSDEIYGELTYGRRHTSVASIDGMLKLHQYAIMCAPTTAQLAAIEALKNGDPDVEEMVAEYDRRRRYIKEGLDAIGIDSFEPEGAFYIWPQIGKFGLSSDEFCERLLNEQRCAIVPGTAFGKCGEGFARISYAYSLSHIEAALDRIEKFVKTIK